MIQKPQPRSQAEARLQKPGIYMKPEAFWESNIVSKLFSLNIDQHLISHYNPTTLITQQGHENKGHDQKR